MKEDKVKEPVVIVGRLKTGVPGSVEYILGTLTDVAKGDDVIITNLLRAVCWLTPVEQIHNKQGGGFRKVMVNTKQWEFHFDDYFTDFKTNLSRDAFLYLRELDSSEELYKNYLNAIDAEQIRKAEAKAKEEVAKIQATKQAEINKRQNKQAQQKGH